ncbi:MAG: UpxY family transcription antiterminator [Terracidiphilus sp.]
MSEDAYRERLLPDRGAMPSDLPEPRLVSHWFAVFTSPRHEKRVEQYLAQREIEHYLPLYRSPRKWRNGLKVVLELPLFPGYIFVRIRRTERVRVLEVPGVLAIVGGTAGEMAPLPDAEVDALRTGLHLRHSEPHPYLTVGQRARIRSGALAGLEGIVVRKKNSLRVVLTLDLIMQSIAVEVDGEELEPVNSGVLLCSGSGKP